MLVSVVVCTYSLENCQSLIQAVDSLLEQTHRKTEIIIVVDENKDLYERILEVWSAQDNIKLVVTEENLGAFGAGNVGVEIAQGSIIAFMDDDAIAERDWLENLAVTYENLNVISVGGKALPRWLSGKPRYLPEEMYWLVGVTHEGFAEEEVVEVRNTFGLNMSFRREVFEEIGLFNTELGFAKGGNSYMQGAEAEFALRMKQALGKGVMYNPSAIVYHKIPPSKVEVKILLKRAFYQGYSKAKLKRLHTSTGCLSVETSYLKSLLVKYIPRRARRVFSGVNSATEVIRISFLLALIVSVGIGFLCGYVKQA